MLTHAVSAALLVIRLALGVIFIAHGAQKLFGWFGGGGLAQTAEFLSTLGFTPPMIWAVVLAVAEFAGGILIIIGLLTRLSAAVILISQIIAVILVHWRSGFFSSQGGFEYNLSLIAMSLALVIAGAGFYSLDWLFRRRR